MDGIKAKEWQAMNKQYTRQEAIELAKITSSKASYYDRIGLVVPQKIGESKKPYVFYSHEQIEMLKHLSQLSKWFNLEALYAFAEDKQVRKAMLNFLKTVDNQK